MEDGPGKGNNMDEKKVIYIGSDHAGFNLKKYLISFLEKRGYKMIDMGNEKYDQGECSAFDGSDYE